ncbi:sodium-dependent transporter [Alkalihalophilus pseudofirmus]|uniref:Transporter n=1 Tax=Alkalihalophilus pseudofirmus TaxID=79885 RepID=A0AAJ2NPN1_ALKPS|nr:MULTISPECIES: sodium-dependent transporter [Alkalihalophilus]MDV2886158.1 sodium-dependent transporter [Alkalihalophilus pseudofirmus]MED1600044.1 sodium-dependent transporter [Alkalihalophilus marmarensis]WEG16448.1 sodium-dependent transporter [Alkalihalophilus pseudofirmus]
MAREQWGTRAGFILAAIGSAVGLGNIWRFPYVAYENGGGAFFLPYLFALLTAGIPLLIMEFTLGHKYRGSAPLSYARLNKKAEWIGWWQVAIAFVISTYYAVIIAWAIAYTYFAFNQSWGEDTGGFLMGEYLQRIDLSGGALGEVGSLVPGVFIPLLVVWAVTLGVLFKGVKRGIEMANRIFIPMLLVMFLLIVIRALTLEGAMVGLDAFFAPNWSEIMSPGVWVAAYGQIFFSLSIAFAIMITYSSYLGKKSDINNNAFITGFSNSSFELLAGIGVFAALGFMATASGVGVDEVASAGIGLAFVVFPEIINTFPGMNAFFGVLFFGSLVLAGLSSLISIVETFVAGIQDKFKVSRTKAVAFGGGLSALISLLFATQGGLFFLDTADYFINQFGVALAGLVSVIAVSWFIRKLPELQSHANGVSDFKTGLWWKVCLSIITPIVLGYMAIQNTITNITSNYEDYPTSLVVSWGWVVAIGAIVIGFVFAAFKWQKNDLDVPTDSNDKGAEL